MPVKVTTSKKRGLHNMPLHEFTSTNRQTLEAAGYVYVGSEKCYVSYLAKDMWRNYYRRVGKPKVVYTTQQALDCIAADIHKT